MMSSSPPQPEKQPLAAFRSDIEAEQVGAVYGKALFEAAENAGDLLEVQEELRQLFDDVFRRYPALTAILVSPMISLTEKEEIVGRVFTGRVSKITLDFLKVLAQHDRLDCLAKIDQDLRRRVTEKQGAVEVQVSTATPLDSESVTALHQKLTTLLGVEPAMTFETDPDLIGGIVVRVEDTVFDGSIANQLEQVREQMINRSAHEIQSRRDRFRHSAGN